MSNSTIQDSGLWHIQLFGSLEVVTANANSIRIRGKKTGELLAYLALHQDRAHFREKLIDLIWGDSEVGDARTRLRQEILKLKSLLANDGDNAIPLLVTKSTCQLRPGTVVDVIVFEEACKKAVREPDWNRKCRIYVDAIHLYKSELLPGYDSPWIVGERARLSQLWSRALLDLAEAQRQLDDFSGAAESLNTLQQNDPLSEECYFAQMRMYAEIGQPTRVQQQFQAMERALRDGLGVAPTAASLQLADDLREAAGKRASIISKSPVLGASFVLATEAAQVSQESDLPAQQSSNPKSQPTRIRSFLPETAIRRMLGWLAIVLLAAVITIIVGLLHLKATHTALPSTIPPHTLVERNKEKWTYIYQPRPGEKPNSEGRAILSDPSGIYVTGLVQTEKDDTDILTLKLGPDGKLLWLDRYSSPEHDCDRAFSECAGPNGRLFVAGETYVPPHFNDAEGWHLVLLYYDKNGRRMWARRSPMITRNSDECVQVASDLHGGCFLAGTALENGRQNALVMRYDASGNLVWHKTAAEGLRTVFRKFVVNSDGDIFVCGTERTGQSDGNVNEDWLVVRLGLDGNVKWTRLEDGPAHGGANEASCIGLDRGGNVLVAGVFHLPEGEHATESGLRMAIQKYGPDGARSWRRVVMDSGPALVVDGIAINWMSDVVLGATERLVSGNWDILLARYDDFGNRTHYLRYPNPDGYVSASIKTLNLADDGETMLFAEVSESKGGDMRLANAIAETNISSDGDVTHYWLFESLPQSVNLLRGCSHSPIFAATGQTGALYGPRELMVLCY